MELQPFEGAANRTATVILQKGELNEYPVPYILWQKSNTGKIGNDLTLEQVEKCTHKSSLSARPVDNAKSTSPWLTTSSAASAALQKALGKSDYEAHEGVNTGGANGVYLLSILKRQSDGQLLVANLYDVGKTKIRGVQALIEPELLYPLLRGRDVSRWSTTSSAFILLPQSREHQREGIPETILKTSLPQTYAYLKEFEELLSARSDRKYYPEGSAFYTMRNVAEYTFSSFKVVWTRVANDIKAAVIASSPTNILGNKPVIPIETATMVAFRDENEAHYFCALLNSSPARLVIDSYASKSTGSFGAPHILKHVTIPRIDPSTSMFTSLSSLSQRAHQLATSGKDVESELFRVEEEIDRKAAELWGITIEELAEIRRSLAEQL